MKSSHPPAVCRVVPIFRVVGPAVALALALAGVPAGAQGPAGGGLDEGGDRGVDLALFHRTYTDLASGLAPIEQGPLTLTVASPEHRLVVHRVRVWLALRGESATAEGGALVRIDTEVDFEGEGQLDIHLSAPGMNQRFADTVVARRQNVRAHATVRVEPHPEGYIVTMAEPGPAVPLAIESGLMRQIVGLCQGLAVLPMMSLDCDALDRALSVVRVPQPQPGERFFLPYEYLGEAEREYFDARIGGSR